MDDLVIFAAEERRCFAAGGTGYKGIDGDLRVSSRPGHHGRIVFTAVIQWPVEVGTGITVPVAFA